MVTLLLQKCGNSNRKIRVNLIAYFFFPFTTKPGREFLDVKG